MAGFGTTVLCIFCPDCQYGLERSLAKSNYSNDRFFKRSNLFNYGYFGNYYLPLFIFLANFSGSRRTNPGWKNYSEATSGRNYIKRGQKHENRCLVRYVFVKFSDVFHYC